MFSVLVLDEVFALLQKMPCFGRRAIKRAEARDEKPYGHRTTLAFQAGNAETLSNVGLQQKQILN